MKVFTAIFAIGAILSTTLATPVAVGETAVEQRNFEVDIAARQLPSVPGLPDLPPLPVPTNPAELASALTNALTQVVTVLAIISKRFRSRNPSYQMSSLTKLTRGRPS